MEPRPTILIADDSPSHLRLMELLLSREGYDVVTVEDGKAVLDHLRHHTPPISWSSTWTCPSCPASMFAAAPEVWAGSRGYRSYW